MRTVPLVSKESSSSNGSLPRTTSFMSIVLNTSPVESPSLHNARTVITQRAVIRDEITNTHHDELRGVWILLSLLFSLINVHEHCSRCK